MFIHRLLWVLAIALTVECRTKGLWDFISDLIGRENESIPEDAILNIEEIATKYGYGLQEHTVTTDDGYIINIHRVVGNHLRNGPIVFLMHGILESSDSWLLQGPKKSLAFLLADEGYDVWLGNARGNKHAINHTSLTNSPEYWQFTWEEIAIYDLPAMMDYILELTGKENLYYVGHSQGTTVAYALLSMKPQYNKKIRILFSLAPEAWMGNVKSPIIRLFSSTVNLLGSLMLDFGSSAGTDFFSKISPFACSLLPLNCDNFMYAMTGYDTKINETLFPIIFGHMPTGSSTLQFVHYGQLVNSERFCRYNYGSEKNKEFYGQEIPPDYEVSNIKVPVSLFYSDKDWLSDPRDVEILRSHLGNVWDHVYCSNFTHMDYVYAEDAGYYIYPKIIDRIKEFETFRDAKSVPMLPFRRFLKNNK